jgi:RHS repeat-associated protein
LRLPDGSAEHYDRNGRLTLLTNRQGLVHTLSYNDAGELASVTAPDGQRLSFSYEGGKLSTLTDPAGGVFRYRYEADNLVQVDYADGTAKLYHYEDVRFPSHLTGMSFVDAGGQVRRFSTYTYDSAGRAVSTERAGGTARFTLTYDNNNQTTVTDAAGLKEAWRFATTLGVTNLVSKQSLSDYKYLERKFGAKNNLTCWKDTENRVTTYGYNATNQRISMTEGQNGNCTYPGATPASRTTTYQYVSPTLDLPTVIESPSSYTGGKKRIAISYTNNLPVSITQSGYTPSGAAVSRSITLAYNALGQVTSIDGPRTDVADVTTLTYYECNSGGACGQLKSLTNAAGQTTTFDVYDGAGRVTQFTDPNGLRTSYEYDARGRVRFVTQTASGGMRVTEYRYTAAGDVAFVALPDGRTLTFEYDAARLLRAVTDNLGNRVAYDYDTRGNRTTDYTYDASGSLVRQIDLAYDIRNRVSQINAGGSITKQVSDAVGNLTKVTDPNTVAVNGYAATSHSYDTLNRITQTVDTLYGYTYYGYDINSNVTQVKVPNNATTTYVNDDLGNLLSETSPDRGSTSYTYDAAGNVASKTDARGVTVTYQYDALNRITAVDYPASGEDVGYSYDSCLGGVGRVCTVTDAAGTTSYDYDAFGNVATQIRSEAGYAYTTRYTYDAGNRVASITYPDGRIVQYTRNAIGQITDVSVTVNSAVTTLLSARSFRGDGLLASQSFGNGLSEIRQYDLQGRLTNQFVGSADTRVYGYDFNGNLKSLQSMPLVGAYTYDALDRLTRDAVTSTPTSTRSFSCNANGNRTSDSRGSYSYLAASNRMTSAPGATISLDAAGNTLANGTLVFTYNNAGQLATAGTGGFGGASYGYNAQNLRTQKTVGSSVTVYHYDLQGRLIAESRGDSTPIRAYVWDDTQPIAQIEYAPGNEKLYYLHTDHLATPRLATDSAQHVVWRYEGEAFGASVPNEDPDGDGVKVTVNLRFPGQYYDAETGLHYNWNRYYDPKTGRYLSPDPMGVAEHMMLWQAISAEQGYVPLELNPYSYTSANPLRWTDPTGLYTCVYSINSHTMTCLPNNPANPTYGPNSNWVSGNTNKTVNGTTCGDCRDNANRTNVSDHGPIPTTMSNGGDPYIIGPNIGGPNGGRRNLTPNPKNGRFKFQLHFCGNMNTCSDGCVASPQWPLLNNLLNLEEGQNTLWVVQ